MPNLNAICSQAGLSGDREENGNFAGGNRTSDELSQLTWLKPFDGAQSKAVQRVEAGVRHMLLHLTQPIKVPELSAMVGLSKSTFFAVFKTATGLTPIEFFIRARMRLARDLLESTSLQIKEISARLGYDDQFYFSRVFKSVHGVAPRYYRDCKRVAIGDVPQRKIADRPGAHPKAEPNGSANLASDRLISDFETANCLHFLNNQRGRLQSEPSPTPNPTL